MTCDADLSYMGNRSDGHLAAQAFVSDDPGDIGPSPAQLVEYGDDNHQGTPSRCGP